MYTLVTRTRSGGLLSKTDEFIIMAETNAVKRISLLEKANQRYYMSTAFLVSIATKRHSAVLDLRFTQPQTTTKPSASIWYHWDGTNSLNAGGGPCFRSGI